MFEVKIRNQKDVCYQMSEQTRQFNNSISELDSIISSVQSLKGMGDIGSVLRKVKDKMQDQSDALRYMGNALNKIASNYAGSENRIIDECDHGVRRFEWKRTGVFNVPQGTGLIQ